MNPDLNESWGLNRRGFLKSGSFATLMTMLGGVRLFADQTTNSAPAETQTDVPKIKVAVIGLGAWGRQIVALLVGGKVPAADLAAVCDTYPAFLKRGGALAPGAAQIPDYKAILANPEIKAVIVATPTHKHKDIVLEALKAGKHVYCEAPLAGTIEDARAIALAAKAAPQQVFQSGLQLRSDAERLFLLPYIRSGALGKQIMARAQWHKKTNWVTVSSNPEQQKLLNWRLSKATSTGLIGEIGIHQLDQAGWFMNTRPVAVTGFGSIAFWNSDGRDVPDTVTAVLEYPGGLRMNYDCTLANSFDSDYEVYFGSDAAVMLRDNKAWMFKEVDAAQGGWEIYARRETFYKETGIALIAGGSKQAKLTDKEVKELELPTAPVQTALHNFTMNAGDVTARRQEFIENLGDSDPEALAEAIAKVKRRPAAGYHEGFEATVLAIKANEAILSGQRIALQPEWFELG